MITTLGRLRGVASLAFAGFLGVGGIGAVVKTIAQFEAGMKRVEALLGDRAVGGAMRALTDKARELGATTAFTATQAAEGMQFLTLAGFDALETFQAIGPALDLAQAGMLGLGEASDIVSNIMQGFSVDASRTGEVVDALAFVATRSNTSIRQLGEAMKFVAPVAGAVGLKVEETAAALGLLGNSGLQASLAGTSLRRVLSGLFNPSKEAVKVFSDMGLKSEDLVTALQDPNKGLVFVIKELEEAGIGAAEAFVLFGQRGAPGLLSLIGQTDKLEAFNENMKKIEGTARNIGAVMIDNLQGDARIAVSALEEAIIRLGEAGLLDWLRESTQAFTAFIRGLGGMDQALEGSSDKIQKWAARGVWLRENVDLLRKSLVVLVAFLNRGLLVSIATAIGRFALLGATVAGLAGPFAVASAGTTLLAGAMNLLRAAIISTGVGALVVAVGVIADWIFFSNSAADANDTTTASFDRLSQKVEDNAFHWKELTTEQRRFAIQDVGLLLVKQEADLKRSTRQLENSIDASRRKADATAQLAASQEILNGVLKVNTDLTSDQFEKGTIQYDALLQREEAVLRIAEAETLLQTATGASAEKIANLTKDIEDNKFLLAAWSAVFSGTDKTVEAFAARMAGAKDAVKELSDGLREAIGLSTTQAIALQDLIAEYSKNELALAGLEKQQELLNKAMERAVDVEKELKLETGTLARIQKEIAYAIVLAERALTPYEKAVKRAKEQIEDLVVAEDALAKAQLDTRRRVMQLRDDFIAGVIGPELFEAAMRALAIQMGKTQEELENTCGKTDELKKCMSEEAKAMATIWDQAFRNIQDTFADAFKGAFDSFSEFSDRLLDAVKNMIAEILSAKLLGGLKNAIANIFGGGAGGGGGGGIVGTIGNLLFGGGGKTAGGNIGSAISTAFSAGFSKVLSIGKGFISLLSTFGEGALNFLKFGHSAISATTGGAAGFAGGVAASGVVGFASGRITDNILGSRGNETATNLLSTVGGAIGGLIGGLPGAIIGGAIGSFTSNLFGGAKALEKATLQFSATSEGFTANVESITSRQRSFFRGRRFTTTNAAQDVSALDEALLGVVETITQIAGGLGVDAADALSGFSFSRDVDIRGKSRDEIEAILNDLFQDTILGVVQEFVENAEGISDRLKVTIKNFEDNTEDFLTAFALAAAIDTAFLIDPVTAVLAQLEESGKSLTTTYDELLVAYRELIAEYDGSLPALEELAAATNIVVGAQVALSAALLEAGMAISTMFQDSAQTIRESLMGEAELYDLRRSQIDDLVLQASTATDPAELTALANEINRLGLDAFNMLDEDQQGTLGQEFIDFFDDLDDLFGDRIDLGLSTVTADNTALDQEVADTMTAASQAIIDASNAQEQLYLRWIESFDIQEALRELQF
jgi:TP901 family phage tail tape measure protein